MSRETQALLEAFDHLSAEEKRTFIEELLRRSLPFHSGPLADKKIGAASDSLCQSLYNECLEGKVRHSLAVAERGQPGSRPQRARLARATGARMNAPGEVGWAAAQHFVLVKENNAAQHSA